MKIPLHKYLVYGWLENLDTVRHIPLGTVWGVRISITPVLWLSPVLFFGLGILQNSQAPTTAHILYLAAVYLIAVEITTVFHGFGHILGGKLVGGAMDELLFTATRGVNIYHGDQTLVPPYIHLGRSLGGPVFNLLVAAVLYLTLPIFGSRLPNIGLGFWSDVGTALASTNLFFGVGSFLPLPSIDGWVIWREVLNFLRSRFDGHAQTKQS